jgi:hypothetical protein
MEMYDMSSSMTWEKLLSKQRQGKSDVEEPTIGRSNFNAILIE